MTRPHHHGHGHHTDRRRSVRPRPINIDERLPIVFLSKRKDAAGEPLDPKLVEWLKEQEAEHEREYKLQAAERAAVAAAAADGGIIHVPQVREVHDHDSTNVSALQDQPRYSSLDPTTAAYFRYQDMWVRQTVGQVLTEYDVEEEDEAWLADVFPTKAAKHAGEHAGSDQQASSLSTEQFEALIQRLELLHFELLKRHAPSFERDIKLEKVPRIPATEKVLSRSAAVRNLCAEEGAHAAWVVEAVYDHWKARRKQMGGPLLQHLWFEMPWKAKSFAEPSDPTELGDMPFMVVETRNSRANTRLRVTEKEAWNILAGVREELEGLRTLADQVKKRERLKKQLLKNWRDQLRLGKGKTKAKSRKAAGSKQAAGARKPEPKAKAAAKASDGAEHKHPLVKAGAGSSASASAGSKQPVKRGSSIADGILPARGHAIGQGSKLVELKNSLAQKEIKQPLKSIAKVDAKGKAVQQQQKQPAPLANGKLASTHAPSRLRNATDATKQPVAKHEGAGQVPGAAVHAVPPRQAAGAQAAQQQLHHNGTAGRSPASPMTAALLVEQALLAAGGAHNKRGLRELAGLRIDAPAPGPKSDPEKDVDTADIAPYIALVSPPSTDNSPGDGSDADDDASSDSADDDIEEGKGIDKQKAQRKVTLQPAPRQQLRGSKGALAPVDMARATRAAALSGRNGRAVRGASRSSDLPTGTVSPSSAAYTSGSESSSGGSSSSEEDSEYHSSLASGRHTRERPAAVYRSGRRRYTAAPTTDSGTEPSAHDDDSTSKGTSHDSDTSEPSWQASDLEADGPSQQSSEEVSTGSDDDSQQKGSKGQRQPQQTAQQRSTRAAASTKSLQPAKQASVRAGRGLPGSAQPGPEQENRDAMPLGARSTRSTQPLKPLNGEQVAQPVNGKKAHANGPSLQPRASGGPRQRGISDKELRALGLELPGNKAASSLQANEPAGQPSQPRSTTKQPHKLIARSSKPGAQLGVRNGGVTKPRPPRGISAHELRALGLLPPQATATVKPMQHEPSTQHPQPQQGTRHPSKQTVRNHAKDAKRARGISDKELRALGLPVPSRSPHSPAQARGAALVRASLDRVRSANRAAAPALAHAQPSSPDGRPARSMLQPASRKRPSQAGVEIVSPQPVRVPKTRRTAEV